MFHKPPIQVKAYENLIFTLIIFVFINLLTINTSNAQEENKFDYEQFENQLLDYKPVKSDRISEANFEYANLIIDQIKSGTSNNPENFNVAYYFNVLSAFLTLKENENNIDIAFKKFRDSEGSCEYILSYESRFSNNSSYDIIRQEYFEKLKECKLNHPNTKNFNIENYSKLNELDLALVSEINQIKSDDQKYRNGESTDWSKQTPLDVKNQKRIDSLFSKYKTYIGKSLVGEKYKHEMWSVIQHSNIEMMEKYLPVIQKGVKEGELDIGPLKMLIDRYYGLKYGYEIFGSQRGFGFEIADSTKRKQIELKYGLIQSPNQ